METLSLEEENTLLRHELRRVEIELETLRATHAILRSEYAREHVLAEELIHLRAQYAQVRAELRSVARQSIASMYLEVTEALRAVEVEAEREEEEEAAPARHIFENHVAAEKAKGSECAILLTPLKDSASVTVSTTCGHIFDTAAFTTWNTTNTECPVCRTPVTSTYIF
jgi:hypothetical protein